MSRTSSLTTELTAPSDHGTGTSSCTCNATRICEPRTCHVTPPPPPSIQSSASHREGHPCAREDSRSMSSHHMPLVPAAVFNPAPRDGQEGQEGQEGRALPPVVGDCGSGRGGEGRKVPWVAGRRRAPQPWFERTLCVRLAYICHRVK
jgi:hypothetical protein